MTRTQRNLCKLGNQIRKYRLLKLYRNATKEQKSNWLLLDGVCQDGKFTEQARKIVGY